MSAPPVPPLPPKQYYQQDPYSNPPPVPPLPPDLRNDGASPPHFEAPLTAPKPFRFDPSIPGNMAQNLDDDLYQQDYQRPQQQQQQVTPGFVMPGQVPQYNASPYAPQGADWSPWAIQAQANTGYGAPVPLGSPPIANPYSTSPQTYSTPLPQQSAPAGVDALSNSLNSSLTFTSNPQAAAHPRRPPSASFGPAAKPPTPPPASASLTAPLPTLTQLNNAVSTIQSPSHDPAQKIAWCRDVFFLVDRSIGANTSNDPPVGPVVITDPQLARLAQIAVSIVVQLAGTQQTPVPPHVAEALYFRGTFSASGAYPDQIQRNPRLAFKDFEVAARAGFVQGWFRVGREYESFNDLAHAKDCFERGVKAGSESCLYRLGMAHLLGQLGLAASPDAAIPLLHRAATLASTATPQPAYVFALLMLGEFQHLPSPLPQKHFASFIPPSSSLTLEVRKHLERAAFLGFAPAQYKLGHAYEFAQPPFPFDPLLSVQYYSLASQQGEVEADMALSKWFLCGSGENSGTSGGFEKDEQLAWTFADKAARRGLPSAEFAMGYYAEVGVGGTRDVNMAIKWYTRAAEHGNEDAKERLTALTKPDGPQALTRIEHEGITESKLVRKRTQAKQRSESMSIAPGPGPGPAMPNAPYPVPGGFQNPPAAPPNGRQVVEMIRKNSLKNYNGPGPGPGHGPGPRQHHAGTASGGRLPAMPEDRPYDQSQPSPPPQQAHFPGANRYQLTDAPVSSTPPAQHAGQGRPHSAGRGRGGVSVGSGTGYNAGRPEGSYGRGGGAGPSSQSSPAPQPPKASSKPGPATFAEMGIHSTKAENKECIIM